MEFDTRPANESRRIRLTDQWDEIGPDELAEEIRRRDALPLSEMRNNCELPVSQHYDGPLALKRPEEVAFMLAEALDYFGLTEIDRPPVPIDRGHGCDRLPDSEEASEIWRLGINALAAMARGKPRSLREAWSEMRRFIHAERHGAAEAAVLAYAKANAASRDGDISSGFVYFIGAEEGAIKIGYSNNPAKRLQTLQTSAMHRLSILAETAGSIEAERSYHRRFAAHRLNGEWFERHPDILAEIDRIRSLTVPVGNPGA